MALARNKTFLNPKGQGVECDLKIGLLFRAFIK
jgi:hypothetical protein